MVRGLCHIHDCIALWQFSDRGSIQYGTFLT
jgi:hypothetical protein